jgi:type I restriction enzyme S subunit
VTRLKDIAIINRASLPESTDADAVVRYVDISSVDDLGRILEPDELRFADAPSRARRIVRVGDSIVSTVRTYLRAVAFIQGDVGNLIVSTGFATLTTREGVDARFLYWAVRGSQFIEDVVSRSVGVSYPAITPTELGTVEVPPLPPLGVQQEVAARLDAATAEVDALVEEQLITLGLVEERVWGLFIDRVLTLDPPRVPLRRVLLRLSDGPFGSAFTSGDYSGTGAAVIRLGNIGFAQYRGDDQARIPMALYERFRRHEVFPGDVLIAGLGDARNHAGRACVAPDLGPAIVKGKCFVASVDLEVASPMFIALYLSSALGRDAVGEAARGSTRSMINLEIAKSSVVLLPPLDAQERIAAEVVAAREGAAELTDEINRQLRLLREHRQAIITAAVTDGLDALDQVA